MRLSVWPFACFAGFLFCIPGIFAQTNPPPPDPHEMVTREPRTVSKPADRSAALDLLDRARKNFDLHHISTPYALKVSFETNGAAQIEGGGTMEEFYDGQSRWRWTGQLQDSNLIRIGAEDRIYGSNPSQAVPLRVQLVHSVLLRPIVHDTAAFLIRAANGPFLG